MNTRNKARIMLFGLFLIIAINLTRGLVFGIFIKDSYAVNLIGNAILFSFGGMWVGWKIKTPSWSDAIVFGTTCVVIFNLLPMMILCRPFTAWAIAVLISGFAGSLTGVFFSGYLARKFQKSVQLNNSLPQTQSKPEKQEKNQ